MVLQSRQNMKKSMDRYLGPLQHKILFQNKFLFLFCPPLKYFSLPKWANSEKIKFYFNFFPTLKIFQNTSALNKVKKSRHMDTSIK
jgi:hypothetical protein